MDQSPNMSDRAAGSMPSPSVVQQLEQQFGACDLARPFRRDRYDDGALLSYDVQGVIPSRTAHLTAHVEKFVGGGFAGQVYRVQVASITPDPTAIVGLTPGQTYAIKILRPPSAGAQGFRDSLFFWGYQGLFRAQVHPASVRVGVLWQKLIRRAMAIRFGDERSVCDTFATFYDPAMGSFGEINEWIDGRIWKFEVDDQLGARWEFGDEPPPDHPSGEYVHKKIFMRRLVALLHDMGAPELARQYEWWTLKSQPNVLKRRDAGDDPAAGLTAVDFRAGLTLLPFLPMSPMDLVLIARGIWRGRWVQFDRSDMDRFRSFVADHQEAFADLAPAITELEQQERAHRDSLPDVTGHHVRLLTQPALRDAVRGGTITAWQHIGWVDSAHADRLRQHPWWCGFWFWLSILPFVGRRLLKLWGHGGWRSHVRQCATRLSYLGRALRGSRIETLIQWHRTERMADERIDTLVDQPLRYYLVRVTWGLLPARVHRTLTDWRWSWSRLREAVSFASKFLRRPEFREEWLLEQVALGRAEGMLTNAEAEKVSAQIRDPYIQKYLRCLAVHLCTLPVTQVVMVLVGGAVAIYCYAYKGMSWMESMAAGSAAGVVIQLLPISPGSISRGLFVLYLMIRERDVRNYYIAAPVSFIHVVGYLAFPLQMVAQNPGLARFMAGRWAKSIVHVVPIFGESGGLLEHGVFDLFFNLPLTIRRGFKTRPASWIAGTIAILLVCGGLLLAGYARIWEWRQPPMVLEGVRVASIVPYYHSGAELHWSLSGVRVVFDAGTGGPSGPVDYPARNWNDAVTVDDRVDAVVRKSFFGDEYDGLRVTKPMIGGGPGARAPPPETSSRE